MDNAKKVTFLTLFSVAATWFSVHCGGGFMQGSLAMGFVTKYGYHAIWTPVIVVLVMGYTFWEIMLLSRNYNAYNFRAMTDVLYYPYNKILSPIYEVISICASVLAISTCIAGGAIILQENLGIPRIGGILIIGGGILALSIFGVELVLKASSVLTVLIVITLFGIGGAAMSSGNAHLGQWMASPEAHAPSLGSAIMGACTYAGFQMFGPLCAMVSVTDVLDSKKSINKAMIIGFIINLGMIFIINTTMMSYMPEAQQSPIPFYYVSTTLGKSTMLMLYIMGLLSAYISTGVGVVYGLAKRYSGPIMARKPEISEKLASFLIGFTFIVMTLIMSNAGITNIINYGFRYLGYVALVMVFLPTITVARMRNIRAEKERRNKAEES